MLYFQCHSIWDNSTYWILGANAFDLLTLFLLQKILLVLGSKLIVSTIYYSQCFSTYSVLLIATRVLSGRHNIILSLEIALYLQHLFRQWLFIKYVVENSRKLDSFYAYNTIAYHYLFEWSCWYFLGNLSGYK